MQSAEQALALDLKLARTHDKGVLGILDPAFDIENRDPSFGFQWDDMQFVVDEDDFPVDDRLVELFHKATTPLFLAGSNRMSAR